MRQVAVAPAHDARLTGLTGIVKYYTIAGARLRLMERGLTAREANDAILWCMRKDNWRHVVPGWKSWFSD